MLICQKCTSDNIQVVDNLQLVFPAKYFYYLSKKYIPSKDVHMYGFDWKGSTVTY